MIPAEILVAALYSLITFVAGCGWSLYRALGWADRIRVWAYTRPPGEGLAHQPIDSMGWN